MQSLNEIEELLQGKLSENEKEIQKYAKKIQKVEDSKKKADADLLTAESEVDVDEYNTAKNAIWSADHAKELYLKQVGKLKKAPLISRKEYQQLLAEITRSADSEHEDQNNRAAKLIAELKEISEESSQTWQQANQLMHLVQREVYKEPEGKIPAISGGTTWSSDKTYNNNETVHGFYQLKIKGTPLAKRSGETEEKRNYPSWI
ncbi:hypothetical protein ACQKTA_09050 [Enterococcus sp. 22-H-5-01]|uniref:hypothetical protein n=1 Tax=Enterococcus sp. 22-H-5-01 TaxID=3418555 RepID=UPI003D016DB5